MIEALLMSAQVLVARLPNHLANHLFKASPLLIGPEADVKLLQAFTWTLVLACHWVVCGTYDAL